jgi:hypothetical protein
VVAGPNNGRWCGEAAGEPPELQVAEGSRVVSTAETKAA